MKNILTNKKFDEQVAVQSGKASVKKNLLKSLMISNLTLVENNKSGEEAVYSFKSNFLETMFLIKENLVTKEKALYQDGFILDNNAATCEILLNKFAM